MKKSAKKVWVWTGAITGGVVALLGVVTGIFAYQVSKDWDEYGSEFSLASEKEQDLAAMAKKK